MTKTFGFSRRGPDFVTQELVAVLSSKTSFEFKTLFDIVHQNLRARNAASGGEEMLRLRAYEKLQNLVQGGNVKKTGKKYKGVASAMATLATQFEDWNADPANRPGGRPAAAAKVSAKPAAKPASKPAAKIPAKSAAR